MQAIFDTDWGRFGLVTDGHAITGLYLPDCIPEDLVPAGQSDLIREAARQIRQYIGGARREFGLPVAPSGSAFMRSVWRHLAGIAYGELRTYGQVAKALGKPGASRAVGMACARNPIPLLIPCHRVVGAGNKLTGFSGGGVEVKGRMIAHESGGIFARTRPCPDQADAAIGSCKFKFF